MALLALLVNECVMWDIGYKGGGVGVRRVRDVDVFGVLQGVRALVDDEVWERDVSNWGKFGVVLVKGVRVYTRFKIGAGYMFGKVAKQAPQVL
ncbi:hypothetical protein Tco_1251308 [Tanacetum coccineum]